MTTLASYFARDVDDEPIPLVDNAYVPAPDEPEPEYTRLHVWGFLALMWYIAYAAIIISMIITLRSYESLPPLFSYNFPECGLGLVSGFALGGVTLFVHRMARREAAR
jgi:hypothetical protein